MTVHSTKRPSLQLSGPKPLHLLDSSIPTPPASAPLVSSPSRPYNPRRQSSISYVSYSNDNAPLSRSNSLNSTSSSAKKKGADRRSTGSLTDRAPVTLAEKHADLLHFIAQKEAKCLELRTQLANHEAELAQLKRKWERIVSRGFYPTHTPTPSVPSSPAIGSSTVVFDGIREGVQGVSRFIAEFSAPVAPSHKSSSSSSSSSFSAGTRYSVSSASSLQSDCEKVPEEVLIVKDTGATPTMSPNPDFHHRRRSQSPVAITTTSPLKRSSTAEEADDSKPSTWADSMGRKWEQLQKGSTFTKNQKRASLLISDVSQSLYSAASSAASALASPSTPAAPAQARSIPSAPSQKTNPKAEDDLWSSLLDDDSSNLGIGILKPDSPKPPPKPVAKSKPLEDEDDWNW